MKKIKDFLNKYKYIVICFFLLLLLCFLFPYSHDDWAWGSQIGIDRLNSFFNNYNGRYVSNLIVIILTRSYVLRSIFVSIVLSLIFYLLDKIIDCKNKTVKLLELLLFAAIPHLILMQSIVWVSGFTNYVFPTLLILLYINFNKQSKSKKYIPLLFLLGIISTLCVEHLTIYCVILSLFYIVINYRRNKKIDLNNLSYFIGSIIGSTLMFTNGAYHLIANNTDTYRNISPIINAISNYFNTITYELVINNYLINIVISVALVIMIYNKTFKKKFNSIKNILLIIFASFPIYTIILNILNVSSVFKYIKYFNALFSAIYLFAIFISLLFLFKGNKLFKFLFIYLSIAVMSGPLLIVSPIGSRCFYSQYIFFIIFAIMLVSEIIGEYKNIETILNKIIKTSIVIVYLFYLAIYANIFIQNNIRQRYLNEHINDSKIVLPLIPSDKFVWGLNPMNDIFIERYKLFYKIDVDKEIEFIPYNEWIK